MDQSQGGGGYSDEALPGVLGNRGKRAFISGEQRPNFEGNRGTKKNIWEQGT